MADSDKRVLLVEADFRRPRVHKYFALDNEVGVSSVIAGDAEILDAIQQTPVKNLWAMPCGPRPHNPSDLLTSPRFKELIDLVRDQYDFIIIDTPPILAVTDSSVVAPRADAVLLVVRLTKHARDSALRTTEMLNGLGARILGVVVNGIGKTAGYGYGYQRYGSYRYGYGYQRYGGYQYSSRYSSGENGESGGYYGEDEERPAKRRAARAKTEAKPEEA
jgi:capsular exopolysaccharide synthesis family protein